MNLRPYQTAAIEALSAGFRAGHRRQLLMMPTGSGKTATAAEMIRRTVASGGQAVFIVDRVVLVDQAVRHLNHLGLRVGVMQADRTAFTPDDQAIVASIHTIRSRGFPVDPQLIVIDEAHILNRTHYQVLRQRDRVPVVGLSATPLTQGLGQTFSRLVQGPSIASLVEDGYLVPVRAFGPATAAVEAATACVDTDSKDFVGVQLGKAMQRRELVADIVSTWKQISGGRPTLVFATDVAHSKTITDDFISEGIAAEHIDAHTPQAERDAIFARFRSGQTKVLSAVNVLGIGFDCPEAQVAILARPTLSLALHIQQLGRVMRPCEGKDHALILDHAGNIARHGLPEHFFLQSLSDREIAAKAKQKPKTRTMTPCPKCGFMIQPKAFECDNCGHERRRKNTVTNADGTLREVDGQAATVAIERQRFYLELRGYALSAGWKSGAAAHRFKERYGGFPPWDWNALTPLTPSGETVRWLRSRQIAYAKARQREAA